MVNVLLGPTSQGLYPVCPTPLLAHALLLPSSSSCSIGHGPQLISKSKDVVLVSSEDTLELETHQERFLLIVQL